MARKKVVKVIPMPAAGTVSEDIFKGKAHKLTWLQTEATTTPADLELQFYHYHQNSSLQYVITHDTFNGGFTLLAFDSHVHMVFRNFMNDVWDDYGETINVDKDGKEV
jgi:hypothetical protein